MNLRISSVLKITGLVLVVISIAMLPPVLVCAYSHDTDASIGFVYSMLIGLVAGLAMVLFCRCSEKALQVRDGFLILAVCWIAASVLGSLPFLLSGILDPADSFFESCSGFSTTGASVIKDVEAMPKGILLWRAISQWLGGAGILVFAVSLMPTLGVNGTNVAEPDTPSMMLHALSAKSKRIAVGIITGYALLTLIETVLLCFGGVSLFHSVVHSMSTLSTGGFSSYNSSVVHFGSTYVNIIIAIFMIIAGTNYTMFYSFSRRGLKAFTEDTEFKVYWSLMIIAFALIFLSMMAKGTELTSSSASNSAFQVISILTTTGFVSDDYTNWPAFGQMMLIILMFIGGCSSSSSSGNKVVRITVLFKLVIHGIQTKLHSNVIRPVRINHKDLPNDTVSAVANSIFLYIVAIFVGALVMSFENIYLLDCFTSTISLLGNVGPCFGGIGPSGVFADFQDFTKVYMSFVMIAGRLEIYTLLILLTPGFWKSN